MKKHYQKALKDCFRGELIRTRADFGLTQAKMAERMSIADRSYAALESGESCCGALTLVFFILYCCEDPAAFLEKVRNAFELVARRAA